MNPLRFMTETGDYIEIQPATLEGLDNLTLQVQDPQDAATAIINPEEAQQIIDALQTWLTERQE